MMMNLGSFLPPAGGTSISDLLVLLEALKNPKEVEDALKKMQVVLTETNDRIAQEKKILVDNEAAFKKAADALEEVTRLQNSVSQAQNKLQQRERDIKQAELAVMEAERVQQAKNQDLQDKAKSFSEREGTLDAREKQLARREDTIAAKERKLDAAIVAQSQWFNSIRPPPAA